MKLKDVFKEVSFKTDIILFVQCIINVWTSVPLHIIETKEFVRFKKRLDIYIME